MRDVVIFGAGKYPRMVRRYLEGAGHRVVAYAVDAAYRDGEAFDGLPFAAFEELPDRFAPDRHDLFVALGYLRMNGLRAEKIAAARAAGYGIATCVHPSAIVATDVSVGENCLILEGATVQPGSALGDGCILWHGVLVSHDARIGACSYLSPGVTLAGDVTLGERCFLGTGAVVINGLTIGARALIGAGATVTRPVEADAVVVPPRSLLLDKRSDEIRLH